MPGSEARVIAAQLDVQRAFHGLSLFKTFLIRSGRKAYIGHETREGWTGALPFYLFWCDACERYAKDYPHSFPEKRYLSCSNCSAYHRFVPWWIPLWKLWHLLRISIKYSSWKRT